MTSTSFFFRWNRAAAGEIASIARVPIAQVLAVFLAEAEHASAQATSEKTEALDAEGAAAVLGIDADVVERILAEGESTSGRVIEWVADPADVQ